MKRTGAALVVAILFISVGGLPARAGKPSATLISVDEMLAARGYAGKPAGTANCSNDDSSKYTGAWTATGWTVDPTTTTVQLNTSTIPSGLIDVRGTLQAAFDAWTGAPSITVGTNGTATRYQADRVDTLLWGRTGGSIATTYTWRWSDGLIESDVVFSKSLAWFQAGINEGDGCFEGAGAKYDVGNIATHEFGHVYGLGHVNGRFETMYPYGYTGETLKRSPTSGEKTGLAGLYP